MASANGAPNKESKHRVIDQGINKILESVMRLEDFTKRIQEGEVPKTESDVAYCESHSLVEFLDKTPEKLNVIYDRIEKAIAELKETLL